MIAWTKAKEKWTENCDSKKRVKRTNIKHSASQQGIRSVARAFMGTRSHRICFEFRRIKNSLWRMRMFDISFNKIYHFQFLFGKVRTMWASSCSMLMSRVETKQLCCLFATFLMGMSQLPKISHPFTITAAPFVRIYANRTSKLPLQSSTPPTNVNFARKNRHFSVRITY